MHFMPCLGCAIGRGLNATAANATVNNTVCEDCGIDYYSDSFSNEPCKRCPEHGHTRGLTNQSICGKC